MAIDILYFAWVRERIGVPGETVDTQARDVACLVEELRGRSERHTDTFANAEALRVALDRTLGDFASPLAGVREVAFFPPMTGG
jgi:molybdopterin synthase sulfur carrier subunit